MMTVKAETPTTYREGLATAEKVISEFENGQVECENIEVKRAELGEAIGVMLNEVDWNDEDSKSDFRHDMGELKKKTTSPAIHEIIQDSLVALTKELEEVHHIIKETAASV